MEGLPTTGSVSSLAVMTRLRDGMVSTPSGAWAEGSTCLSVGWLALLRS